MSECSDRWRQKRNEMKLGRSDQDQKRITFGLRNWLLILSFCHALAWFSLFFVRSFEIPFLLKCDNFEVTPPLARLKTALQIEHESTDFDFCFHFSMKAILRFHRKYSVLRSSHAHIQMMRTKLELVKRCASASALSTDLIDSIFIWEPSLGPTHRSTKRKKIRIRPICFN